MRPRLFVATCAALAIALTSSACGRDSLTSPEAATSAPSEPSHALLSGLLGAATSVTPLKRITPLPTNQTASATIGILGGVITLPGAGLTVVVPPLAVSKSTKFTVTALAGSAVAYDFAPAGIHFTTPLVATQNLKGTQAQSGGLINPLALSVGYFPDANRITSVTELLNVNVNLLSQTSVFTIWHFSGYIFASGRSSE